MTKKEIELIQGLLREISDRFHKMVDSINLSNQVINKTCDSTYSELIDICHEFTKKNKSIFQKKAVRK